jgi:hypothetical protein
MEPLDYTVGACGVAAGVALLMVTARPRLKQRIGIVAPLLVMAIVGAKAATDIIDPFDDQMCLVIALTAAVLVYFAVARTENGS